jgi:hypothetical protein
MLFDTLALKTFRLASNYGFYGPQQPLAAISKPSSLDDLAICSYTRLLDRREINTPISHTRPSHQTRLFTETTALELGVSAASSRDTQDELGLRARYAKVIRVAHNQGVEIFRTRARIALTSDIRQR